MPWVMPMLGCISRKKKVRGALPKDTPLAVPLLAEASLQRQPRTSYTACNDNRGRRVANERAMLTERPQHLFLARGIFSLGTDAHQGLRT